MSELVMNFILACILIASGYAAGYTHMRSKHEAQVREWAAHADRVAASDVPRSATARRSPAHRAPDPASPEGTD